MTVNEAKKLIGKKIQYNLRLTDSTFKAYITGVRGRNIEINHSDWIWIPDMRNVKVIEETA